jgi:hypothetical protein
MLNAINKVDTSSFGTSKAGVSGFVKYRFCFVRFYAKDVIEII